MCWDLGAGKQKTYEVWKPCFLSKIVVFSYCADSEMKRGFYISKDMYNKQSIFLISRMVRGVKDMMMVDVRLNLNVSFAILNFILELP